MKKLHKEDECDYVMPIYKSIQFKFIMAKYALLKVNSKRLAKKYSKYKKPSYYKANGEVDIINRGQRLLGILEERNKKRWTEQSSIIVIRQLMDLMDSIYEVQEDGEVTV